MSGDRTAKEEREWARTVDHMRFQDQMKVWNSNIYALLVSQADDTRFLKILSRDDGTWLAMAGSYDEEGGPIVAYGNGETTLMALKSLGRSLAGNHWRVDKYELEKRNK